MLAQVRNILQLLYLMHGSCQVVAAKQPFGHLYMTPSSLRTLQHPGCIALLVLTCLYFQHWL